MAVTRDRLLAMALTAGDFGPHPVQISGLLWMASDASPIFIKPEAPVRIGHIFSETDFLGGWGQGDQLCSGSLSLHKKLMGGTFVFILFIYPRSPFTLLLAIATGSDFFLCKSRCCVNDTVDSEQDRSYQTYQKAPVGLLCISVNHDPKFFHLPPLTGLMDTKQALLGQAIVQLLQRRQIGVLVLMTGLTRVRHFGIFQRVFGQQGHERMGVIVSGFVTFGYSGHVAANAVGK